MHIRKAKPSDIPAVIEIAVDSVSRNPFPFKIDQEAMAETMKVALGPAHFAWVTEDEGKVVAAVGAIVQPSFWHEKLACSVLLYHTMVPGGGIPLLRQFAQWVKGRPAIKVAMIEFEPDVDPRLVKYMKRLGFGRETQNLTYVRSPA